MQLPTPTGPFRPHEHRPGAEFGDRMLGSIERHEAVQWAERHERKQSVLQAVPKSNKVRVIALTPPARDALLSLPEREGPVFVSKAGGRLCAPRCCPPTGARSRRRPICA